MIQYTSNLSKERSNPLGSIGNLCKRVAIQNESTQDAMRKLTDIEKFLDGSRVAEFVGHHRHVVESIKVGEGLSISLVFDQFLSSAMEESDVRVRS